MLTSDRSQSANCGRLEAGGPTSQPASQPDRQHSINQQAGGRSASTHYGANRAAPAPPPRNRRPTYLAGADVRCLGSSAFPARRRQADPAGPPRMGRARPIVSEPTDFGVQTKAIASRPNSMTKSPSPFLLAVAFPPALSRVPELERSLPLWAQRSGCGGFACQSAGGSRALHSARLLAVDQKQIADRTLQFNRIFSR